MAAAARPRWGVDGDAPPRTFRPAYPKGVRTIGTRWVAKRIIRRYAVEAGGLWKVNVKQYCGVGRAITSRESCSFDDLFDASVFVDSQ